MLHPFLTNTDGTLPTLQSYPQQGAEILAWVAIDRTTRAIRTQLVANGSPVSSSNPLPISVAGGGSFPQAGVATIAINETTKAIVFPTAFAAAPVVVVSLAAPDNTGFVISCVVDESTRATTGFTALLGAAVPTGTYKLLWFAAAAS